MKYCLNMPNYYSILSHIQKLHVSEHFLPKVCSIIFGLHENFGYPLKIDTDPNVHNGTSFNWQHLLSVRATSKMTLLEIMTMTMDIPIVAMTIFHTINRSRRYNL